MGKSNTFIFRVLSVLFIYLFGNTILIVKLKTNHGFLNDPIRSLTYEWVNSTFHIYNHYNRTENLQNNVTKDFRSDLYT